MPSARTQAIERGDFEFSGEGGELRVRLFDYHADPVHLTREDLKALGLVPKFRLFRWNRASAVRAWLRSTAASPSRMPAGPRPPGLSFGGFHFVSVDGGLDVYADDECTRGAILTTRMLERLGLVPARPAGGGASLPAEEGPEPAGTLRALPEGFSCPMCPGATMRRLELDADGATFTVERCPSCKLEVVIPDAEG